MVLGKGDSALKKGKPAFPAIVSTRAALLDVIAESRCWYSETDRLLPPACREVTRLQGYRADLVTVARIRGLIDYRAGWDGADGRAPSKQALADAESFARRLPFSRIHAPHVSLAADGEVNFLWMLPTIRIDLGFYGDGTYSFYALTAVGREFISDTSTVSEALPSELLALLERQETTNAGT